MFWQLPETSTALCLLLTLTQDLLNSTGDPEALWAPNIGTMMFFLV
jgi:hypothetical protein